MAQARTRRRQIHRSERIAASRPGPAAQSSAASLANHRCCDNTRHPGHYSASHFPALSPKIWLMTLRKNRASQKSFMKSIAYVCAPRRPRSWCQESRHRLCQNLPEAPSGALWHLSNSIAIDYVFRCIVLQRVVTVPVHHWPWATRPCMGATAAGVRFSIGARLNMLTFFSNAPILWAALF